LFLQFPAIFIISRPGTFVSRPDWFFGGATNVMRAGCVQNWRQKVLTMDIWVVAFLIIALIAALVRYGGITGASIQIIKALFFIAVVLFVVSAVLSVARGRRPEVLA